jgi:phenylalanyl-tRNA synthetase beta chain
VDEDRVEVEVPGYRVDVEREVDLIEEIVRVQGYERVGSSLPAARQPGGLPAGYAFIGRVRRSLVRAGLREVRQVPFVSDTDLALFGDPGAVPVTNPLQADEGYLRPRMAPGLLKALRRNLNRHVRGAALFEIGAVFRSGGKDVREERAAGFVLAGRASQGWAEPERSFDVFDGKGVVEAVLADLGVRGWALGDPPGDPFHPGRSAEVRIGPQVVGAFGELHPRAAASLDLAGRVTVGELDLEALMGRAGSELAVLDLPRFPPVRRDLAFMVAEDTPAGGVQAALEEAAGDLLGGCVLFDVHQGPPLPEGRKSLAFSVDLRAQDRTLTAAEADAAVAQIVERLGRDLGAELRAG